MWKGRPFCSLGGAQRVSEYAFVWLWLVGGVARTTSGAHPGPSRCLGIRGFHRLAGSPSIQGSQSLILAPPLCPRIHSVLSGCYLQSLSIWEATWPAWPFSVPSSKQIQRERDKTLYLQLRSQCYQGLVTKSSLKPVLGTNDPQSLAPDMPGKDGQILLTQQGAGTGLGWEWDCCC